MQDEFDDEDGSGLIKDLRAQIKNLSRERDELTQSLAQYRSQERQSSLGEILAARGVKAGVAKFIPDDVEGEEAVNAWLDENADLFGVSSGGADQPVADAETVDQTARMQNLAGASVSPSKVADLQQRLSEAQTSEEVDAIWSEVQQFAL